MLGVPHDEHGELSGGNYLGYQGGDSATLDKMRFK
jgi:hypothetical protein